VPPCALTPVSHHPQPHVCGAVAAAAVLCRRAETSSGTGPASAEIGIGLTFFGVVFTFLGIVFFFDQGLLSLGNVCAFRMCLSVPLHAHRWSRLSPTHPEGSAHLVRRRTFESYNGLAAHTHTHTHTQQGGLRTMKTSLHVGPGSTVGRHSRLVVHT
jgi:hypothetical protein